MTMLLILTVQFLDLGKLAVNTLSYISVHTIVIV